MATNDIRAARNLGTSNGPHHNIGNGYKCDDNDVDLKRDIKEEEEEESARSVDRNPTYDGGSDDLDALQLSDSLFPTGMFAASSGLELMFTEVMLTTAKDLFLLCKNMIERQVGPSDCVALASAYESATCPDTKNIEEIDLICCSMKTVQEVREASVRSGVQLCRCVATFCNDVILTRYQDCIARGAASGVYPISLGVCCRALGIRREKALHILLYGFVAGMTGAALRLGMIQHLEAQKIIHDLKPTMREAVRYCADKNGSEMWQFCPHAEILQMAHERTDSKMFIT